ncbi:MAG: PAS domain-containing sensor histidine kinase [Steroidobacteraceae bacterium]
MAARRMNTLLGRVAGEDSARLEARLETAVWGTGVGLWEIDFVRDRTRWFGDWCERMNIDPCDGQDHVARWDALVHSEDLEEATRRFRAHLAGSEDHYDAEYRVRDRSGRWRWLFERGRVVERAPDGVALRMVGVCMNIDSRKGAEIDLVTSRKRLKLALETARGGMWDLDPAGSEPRQADFFYRMLGVEPQVGRLDPQFWSSRLHPGDGSRVRESLRRAVEGGVLYEAEYRLRHADGSWRWVLDRGRALEHDASGRALHLVGFIVEIADPYSLERELIEIANREQQRIGSDLHDGLGQDLTGIALMLRGIGAQIRREGSVACEDIEEVIGLVNAAIESTRSLARGLSPVSAEHDGLTAALQALAARATERYGIPVTFEAHVAEPLPSDETAATHVYRIAQEALTNAMRHSHATQVAILLTACSGELQLEVTDDGRGFPLADGTAPPNELLEVPSAGAACNGLGLKIMRYRAQMLGGHLALGVAPGGGAIVRCSCPLRQAQMRTGAERPP